MDMGKGPGLAIAIMSKAKPKESEPEEDAYEMGEDYALDYLYKSLKGDDPGAFKSAFKHAVEMCLHKYMSEMEDGKGKKDNPGYHGKKDYM